LFFRVHFYLKEGSSKFIRNPVAHLLFFTLTCKASQKSIISKELLPSLKSIATLKKEAVNLSETLLPTCYSSP